MMRLAMTRLSEGGRLVPVAMSWSEASEESSDGVVRWK